MDSSIPRILEELKNHAPALGAWTYIALWGLADMAKRMKEHPDAPRFADILFPHSEVPLFTEEQARSLEEAWKATPLFAKQVQTGGSQEPGVLELFDRHTEWVLGRGNDGTNQRGGSLRQFSSKVGNVMGTALGNADPEWFSPDHHIGSFWNTLDTLDTELTNFSKQYGLMALESVAPDPKFIIPLGPFPLPVMIPVKMVLPMINIVLEILRYLGPKIPLLGSFTQAPLSILLALLDLARGNLYHALFSMLGIFGRSPMVTGMILKIVRDAFMLISPNIRTELRSALYKSSKSFVVGFFFWLFTVVSPEIIRRPIVALLGRVQNLAETYNLTAERLSEKATTALGGVATVEFPQLPSERIPSFSDLYLIQEYIQMPQVYCHPDVDTLLQSMRSIPPLALFFDLMNIPQKDSAEWQQACAQVESTPLADYLKPTIQIAPVSTPAENNL